MYSNRRFFPLKGVSTSANTGKVSCRLLITIQNIISSYRCKKCAYNLVVSNICVTHTHTHTHSHRRLAHALYLKISTLANGLISNLLTFRIYIPPSYHLTP